MIKRFLKDIYFDATWIVVLAIFIFTRWDNSINEILGMSLALVSFILWIWARKQLGNSFSILPAASSLIKKGIYSKIRHPMYVFSSLTLLGLFISINSIYLYIAWLALIAVQVFRANKENKILYLKFGSEYEAYKKETWF